MYENNGFSCGLCARIGSACWQHSWYSVGYDARSSSYVLPEENQMSLWEPSFMLSLNTDIKLSDSVALSAFCGYANFGSPNFNYKTRTTENRVELTNWTGNCGSQGIIFGGGISKDF